MSTSSSADRKPSPASYDMAGQVAIVTGGLGGIGNAIVVSLKAAGATVCIWDQVGAGGDVVGVDIVDRASVEAALAETLKRHGRIDMLINNAGYAGATLPVIDYPQEEWTKIIDVNLNGTFLVCKVVVPAMIRSGWGRVVNVASLAGKEGTPNAAAYSAAKAGVIALTKSLGKELVGTGVLVNAVAPAAVKTRLLEQMQPSHVQTMIDKSPMKRLGEVEEVAELVLWLCSSSCSFNTGAIFDLSGGRATY